MIPESTSRAFAQYRDTPLWHMLERAVTELQDTKEISLGTAPDYVVGYLCERLVTGHAVDERALRDDP